MQFSRVEIGLVDVRDFQFAPGGGLDFTCNVHDVLIIKIKPGHGVAGFGMLGFLLEGADFHILIELDHAVTLGIADVIPEDGRALFLLPGADEEIFEAVAEENIVPKDQAGVASLDEISGKEERLSDTFRLRLCDVFKGASPLAAVPEKFAGTGQPSSGVVMMATSRMPPEGEPTTDNRSSAYCRPATAAC